MSLVDVVIIGAGVQGAGVAQACAAQGWQTVLLDKNAQPAMETSSRSSKLIHGGLRYLETAQFKLVYDCLKERNNLLHNASDLVSLVSFYIPVYKSSKRHPLWIAMGLCLYNLLAYCAGGRSRGVRLGVQSLPKSQWQMLGLNTQGLKKIFVYFDAQTDDAELTRRVVASAVQHGAQTRFNSTVTAISHNDHLFTVQLANGESLQSKCVVNAAGPWVDQIAKLGQKFPSPPIRLVQGSHIVLNRPALPGCIYAEAPQDGRAVFMLPWKGLNLVGTTETAVAEPKAEPTPTEIAYLLAVYNHYFPAAVATETDITQSFAGIRVLPQAEPGAAAHKLPRETVYSELAIASGTYIGIYGGKLTSYRSTSDVVLRKLATALKRCVDPAKRTNHMKI